MSGGFPTDRRGFLGCFVVRIQCPGFPTDRFPGTFSDKNLMSTDISTDRMGFPGTF